MLTPPSHGGEPHIEQNAVQLSEREPLCMQPAGFCLIKMVYGLVHAVPDKSGLMAARAPWRPSTFASDLLTTEKKRNPQVSY